MANSQRKTILNYLRDTLFPTITTANGYNNNISTMIKRDLRPPEKLGGSDFPACFIASADEERVNNTGQHFLSRMTVRIYGYVQANQDVSAQEKLDDLIEDFMKALYHGSASGGADDMTHGGRVNITEVQRIFTDEGGFAPYAGFRMDVEFVYVRTNTTP